MFLKMALAYLDDENTLHSQADYGDMCLVHSDATKKIIIGSDYNSTSLCIANNNVGIRKTNPQTPLDVNGIANFGSNISLTNSTGKANIYSKGGNIGIATNNPTQTLDVNGNIKTNVIYLGSSTFGYEPAVYMQNNVGRCDIALGNTEAVSFHSKAAAGDLIVRGYNGKK
jgi:hypothetical protein